MDVLSEGLKVILFFFIVFVFCFFSIFRVFCDSVLSVVSCCYVFFRFVVWEVDSLFWVDIYIFWCYYISR